MPNDVRPTALTAAREFMLAMERTRAAQRDLIGLGRMEFQAVTLLIARGPLVQRDLAMALSISAGTATSLIDRLERDGVARRVPHPTDRRSAIVELVYTDDGPLRRMPNWLAEAFTVLSEEQQAAAVDIFTDLAVALRERYEAEPMTEQSVLALHEPDDD